MPATASDDRLDFAAQVGNATPTAGASSAPAPRRSRRSRHLTLRLRLTLLYGACFLVAGTSLLAITYGLVAHSITTNSQGPVTLQTRIPPGKAGFVALGGARVQSDVFVQKANGPPSAGSLVGLPPNVRPTIERLQTAYRVQLAGLRSSAIDSLLTESGIALVLMAFVSIALGWLVAGRALRPIRTMNARARAITEDSLHERLAVGNRHDELGELAGTFDELLGRLERAFDSQRLFVANASHELRTPLTVERALVEVALADPEPTVTSLRETCRRVLVAGEQQERTIEALLTLARSQRGIETHARVDLALAAAEVVRGLDPEDITVDCELEPAPAFGDPALLERLIANLAKNAVIYNQPGGWVRIATRIRSGRPALLVSNCGPIVTPEEAGELVEPFRRLNGGRTSHDAGIGLGLSIVNAIATAHSGELDIRPRFAGGLDVEVRFAAVRDVPA